MSQLNQMPIWLRQMTGWEDSPPWLLELIMRYEQGAGFEDLEDSAADLGFETAGAASMEAPKEDDWLSKLEAEVPVEQAPAGPAPVPDWLAGLETEAPTTEMPAVPQDQVPDWLSGIQTQAPAPEAEPAEKEDVPDWLSGIQAPAPEATPAPQEEVPGWLVGFEDRLAAQQEQEADGETEPDWLTEVEEKAEEPEAAPAGGAEMPGWLSQFESGAETGVEEAQEPAAEPEAQEPGLPDWLSGLETEAPEWLSQAQAGATPTAAAAPDWLSEFEQEVTAPAEPEQPALQEPAPEIGAAEEEAVPDWLAGLQPGTPEAEAGEEEAAPDWLTRLQPETPEAEAAAEEAAPDWLTRLQPETPEAEAAAEEAAPDWLTRLQPETPEAEAAAEEAAPDWLTHLQPEAPEAEAAEEEAAPDWLTHLQPETPEIGAAEEEAAPDWLTHLQPETPEAEAAEEEAAPDWLTRLQPEAPEAEAAAEGPKAEESPAREEGVPDWLVRMAGESPVSEAGAGTLADEEEVHVPDWLAGLEPAQEPETSEQDLGVPDWLAQMTADLPEQERAPERPEETLAEPEEGIPSWLAGMGTGRLAGEEASLAWLDEHLETAPQEPTAEQPAQPEEEEGVPGWLQDMGEVSASTDSLAPRSVTDWLHGIQEMPVPSQPVPEEPEEEPVLPGWLQDIETAVPAQSEEKEAAPEEPVEIPDWLREAPEEAMPEPEPGLPAEDQETQVELPATPSWMQDVYTLPERPAPADDLLALPEREAAETPDWLEELRPEQEEAPAPIIEGHEETSGPLAGLRGILDPEPLLAIFPKSTYRPVPRVPDEQIQQVAVVEQILSEPATRPQPAARATGRLVMASLGRWIMYLLILATLMIAPLRTWVHPPATTGTIDRTSSFRDAINGLEAGSRVLLVVDYDPALDGEMTPLARAVIWHLLQRNVGIVTVSLTPQGPAMAQDLFDELAPQRAGQAYVNLGYLPAHPASLQAFALAPLAGATFPAPEAAVRQTPLGQQVNTLSDMDLVVLLSGDPSRVRWWIEQASILGPADMVAGVSMAAMPYVLPYFSSGQLDGLLAGLSATADYENNIGAGFVPSSRENFIVTANLQLLLVAVLVLTALLSVVRGRSKAS